ncbi:TolC family protein [bacterium]|nr:TolC family protein [bacterium]
MMLDLKNKALIQIGAIAITILIYFCFNSTQLLFAEEKPFITLNENSTLDDYIQYALLNNPELESYFYKWKAALEKIPQEKSLPDPNFTYGYFIKSVETRLGPQEQFFTLAQKIPWFEKLKLKGAIADKNANAEFEKYNNAKLMLTNKIKKSYYMYYFLGKSHKILNENIELLKYTEQVAQAKFKSGSGVFDVLKIQIEQSKLNEKLKTIIDHENSISSDLNALLNRDINVNIPLPQKISHEIIEFDEQELLDTVIRSNPEIIALNQDIESSKLKIKLANENYIPDFTFGINYIEIDKSIMDVAGSGRDAVAATVMLNIPLWANKYQGMKREALNQYHSSRYTKEGKINSITSDLKTSLNNYDIAIRNLDLYQNDLIPKANEWLQVSESAYQTGKLDIISFIDVQRNLLEFQLSAERSLTDLDTEIANIEMLVGKELPKKNLTLNREKDFEN